MLPRYLSSIWADIAPAIANHLWQSTLFAVTVGLPTLALRKNQARVQYWLWLTASCKFLIPFSLLVNIGSRLAKPHASAKVQTGLYSAMEVVGQPFSQPTGTVIVPTISSSPFHGFVHLLPTVLMAGWLCGFLVIVFLWWIRWRRIAATVRGAVPIREGRELEALRRMERIAGEGTPLELLSSKGSLEPGIFGITRPVLVWPEGISQNLEDAHLEAILAHEIWHVRRRDNLVAAIQMLIEAIFWFHPLVWWSGAQILREREFACDEEVLQLGGEPQVYAESILKVCKFCLGSPLACVSGVTGADLKMRIAHILSEQTTVKLDLARKLLLLVAGSAAFVVPAWIGVLNAPASHAQSSTAALSPPQSGHKMEFEVASVRQNKTDGKASMNVDPTPGDGLIPTGGLYEARNIVLAAYIAFAYKLTNRQLQSVVSQVPWVSEDRFDIEARAEGNPTKDQYRLMMQSLLADRFKMAVHFETRQVPLYGLVLAKPGKLGPQLRLHRADDPVCTTPAEVLRGAAPVDAEGFPERCGGPQSMKPSVPGRMKSGGRDVPMSRFAAILTGVGVVDRPMQDETGLHGTVDYSLEWMQVAANVASGADFHPDESAPTFEEAVKEQLGIKMVSHKGPVDFFVVDHLEHPSEN
jgi:bla regulator protein BlaR1